ncbi:MAG: glycosyltransferase [Oscillospiraceae bacterium]|jgi:glycosyltransferase involved in cell wall biosynthesis|nr:glycosyltransferase [Oscillospiraceae bacterium]
MHNGQPVRCSVLLAAYCGEAFLGEQLDSILPQMGEADELLISDDSPPGERATGAIAEQYAAGDARVRILEGPRLGSTTKNVEFLLTQARGEILVLSDQDDVWLPGKLAALCVALRGGALLAMHNATLVDGELRSLGKTLFEEHNAKSGFLRNFIRNGYTGCCMALHRELLRDALPFPPRIPMHDQWLGLVAERRGRVAWIDTPLLLHRRHNAAQTLHGGSPAQRLRWRLRLVRAFGARRHAKEFGIEVQGF